MAKKDKEIPMVACLVTWSPICMTFSQLTFSSVEGGVWSNNCFHWFKQTKPTSPSSPSPKSKSKRLYFQTKNKKEFQGVVKRESLNLKGLVDGVQVLIQSSIQLLSLGSSHLSVFEGMNCRAERRVLTSQRFLRAFWVWGFVKGKIFVAPRRQVPSTCFFFFGCCC